MLRKIFGLVAIFLVVFQLSACIFQKSDEEQIVSRIDEFTNAYNDGDLDGVLACLDAKTRKTCESMKNLSESIGGAVLGFSFDLSDLFGISIGFASDDDVLSFDIQEISMEDDKESATVSAQLKYNDRLSENDEFATFYMVKENGEWYIKDLR